jgi:hypothetical protein
MAQIHKFNSPVDISKESIGNYYVNLYDFETGEFVEGRHYEMYSGNAMMDEVKDLKRIGYRVEW